MNGDEENKKYMKEKVDYLMKPLMKDLMTNLPKEPILFMLQWLYKRTNLEYLYEKERDELNQLRACYLRNGDQDINSYKNSIEDNLTNNKESECNDDGDITNDQSYANNQSQIVQSNQTPRAIEEDDDKKIEMNFVEEYERAMMIQPVIVASMLQNTFLLNSFSHSLLYTVSLSFQAIHHKDNQYVFKANDKGHLIYLINYGTFECLSKDEELMSQYSKGDIFGEQAFFSETDHRRAMSFKSIREHSVLFALSKDLFNKHFKPHLNTKIKRYLPILKASFPILKQLSEYKLLQCSMAIREVSKSKEEIIISPYDDSEPKFYLLANGEAYAYKNQASICLMYKEGDYFGEMAIISPNRIRSIYIKAKTDVILYVIDKEPFKHIMASINDTFIHNASFYI